MVKHKQVRTLHSLSFHLSFGLQLFHVLIELAELGFQVLFHSELLLVGQVTIAVRVVFGKVGLDFGIRVATFLF